MPLNGLRSNSFVASAGTHTIVWNASGVLVALFLVGVTAATAGPPKMELSVAGDVLIPMGSWSDVVGVGLEAMHSSSTISLPLSPVA